MTTNTLNLPWSCKCGFKRDRLNRDASDKCPRCYTFSADHLYWSLNRSGRCDTCDTRIQSHR